MSAPSHHRDEVMVGVVIDLPQPLAERVRSVRADHGLLGAEGIPEHVTLLPPITIATDALDAAQEHLATVAAAGAPFLITLDGVDTFRPVSPVVFLRVAEGAFACDQLQRAVRTGPLTSELNFPYHPHVTVAHMLPDALMNNAMELFGDLRAQWDVDSFVLYEREPGRPWRRLQEFRLS